MVDFGKSDNMMKMDREIGLRVTHKPLYDKLSELGIPIIQTTSKTIKNLTKISKHTNNATISHADIYSILYKDCDKYYISKTQHNLEKRIYLHKQLN